MERTTIYAAVLLFGVGAASARGEPSATTIWAERFTERPVGEPAPERGWKLSEAGRIACTIEYPTNGLYTFIVVARGEGRDDQWPMLTAGVEDRVGLRREMRAEHWASYTFALEIAAGARETFVGYAGGDPAGSGEAGLYVAHLTIVSPGGTLAVVPPARGADVDGLLALPDGWVEQTRTRIENERKGTLAVAVIDERGEPIVGGTMFVEQLRHEFAFGTVLCPDAFDGTLPGERAKKYRQHVEASFNSASTGNALAWANTEPASGEVDYAVVDQMAAWCEARGIRLRGQGLFSACEEDLPAWLTALDDRALSAAVSRRAREVVNRYQGRIAEFDVNEGMLRCDYFQKRMGESLVRRMFHEAERSGEDTRLYVNEAGPWNGESAKAYRERVQSLLDAGLPVSGVGLQVHADGAFDVVLFKEVLDMLDRFQLPIKITAFSCEAGEEQRAATLAALFRTAFAHPAVQGIYVRGMWEGCHEPPRLVMWGADFQRKKAAEVYERLVKKEWWTREEGTTDEDGLFSCEGFFGELEVTARTPDGRTAKGAVRLERSQGSASMVLQLEGAGGEARGVPAGRGAIALYDGLQSLR